MASSLLIFVRAFSVMCLFSAALSEPTFPTMEELIVEFYTTEVQVTDMEQEATAYATEYYNNIDDQGAVKFLIDGEKTAIYYDNDTFEVFEVNETTCVTWEEDESQYYYNAPFYGWLTHKPLVIGPSAPLWFAQLSDKKPQYEGTETARDIPCDKFSLNILGPQENVTLYYYFAPDGWTTPYNYKQQTKALRIPIRIHAIGQSSQDTQDNAWVPINMIYDFSYFKPTIDDLNNLLPPIGIGCPLRKPSEDLPDTPDAFQFSAEVVDLLSADEHEDIDVNFLRVWYDYKQKLARLVYYSRKSALSQLYDFNSGVMYNIVRGGACEAKPLKDSFFETYDMGFVGRMKTPNEVFAYDDTYYDMGEREIRGVKCDVYETVKEDVFFMGQKLVKLVVTVYFTEDFINVGVNGVVESRIPIYFLVTGWNTYNNISLKLQYNIYTFHDVIWPEMYSSFQLERCYTKPESKAYFVLILNIGAADAAKMEEQNDLIIQEVRSKVAEFAQVHPMRIPFLKADYKPTGVFVTGLVLERPPSLLQFYLLDSGPATTYDQNLKPAVDAVTIADCATACIDEGDFPCKGFYFCGSACFLKSIDPYDANENAKSTDLDVCDEYIRAEKDSTNSKNTYLKDAMKNLEDAVLNGNVTIFFQIPNGEEIVKFQDIVVGDGPYTGVDAGDKPYKLNVPLRKLKRDYETTTAVTGVEVVHDCYKKCKESETGCSSFSFCGRSNKEEKECLLSSELIVRGITNDNDLDSDTACDIYDLKFLEYFDAYQEQVSFISGYKVIKNVLSTEKCAEECRKDTENTCRGFEYCRSMKTCSLHSKHILDLKPGEKGSSSGKNPCVHYAAKFLADYSNVGRVLIADDSNVRYGVSAEECAKVCSEELGEACKSFNHCPKSGGGTCSLSSKLLRDDGITTKEIDSDEICLHYEKKQAVHDWGKTDAAALAKGGYTKKGFTGLVIGMLVLGIILGALGFVFYSYMRSRQSGEGMSVRFMKQET